MIHKFSLLDRNIVVDVESGAVLTLDPTAFALLDYASAEMPENPPKEALSAVDASESEIRESWNELREMVSEGLLFAPAQELDPDITKVMGFAPVKALCLHVAHDCNLRCKYCFASTGDFGTGRKLMSPEVAKKAIDFVVKRSGKRTNIEIDFFGGEPLLAMDTVKETIEYCKNFPEKNFRFTITTNGVALDDETIDYINEHMSNVVLSLDGRKPINDEMRPAPNGKGSFDVIVPKFQKLVKDRKPTGKDYYVRGTFTKKNLDFADDVIEMYNLGFDQLSIEPVVADKLENIPSEENRKIVEEYALTEADLPTIYREYERLVEEMLKNRDFNFFHFNIDLEQGPCVIKRLRGCGAGFEYVAITPEGDIYPCHQFVGKPEYLMGNVFTDGFDTKIAEQFGRLNVYTRPDCADCWAKYYCSGGCNAANLAANGALDKAYKMGCDLERKRVECAIALKVREMEEDA